MVRVCLVCLGNIRRSPLAEVVLRDLVSRAHPSPDVVVDSAGTGRYHLGDLPDPRAGQWRAGNGLVMTHRARQFHADELDDWDLVVAMDHIERDLRALARSPEQRARIRLLRSFDPEAVARGDLDVPDPYYSDETEFEAVLDMVEAGCVGLLAQLRAIGGDPRAMTTVRGS